MVCVVFNRSKCARFTGGANDGNLGKCYFLVPLAFFILRGYRVLCPLLFLLCAASFLELLFKDLCEKKRYTAYVAFRCMHWEKILLMEKSWVAVLFFAPLYAMLNNKSVVATSIFQCRICSDSAICRQICIHCFDRFFQTSVKVD